MQLWKLKADKETVNLNEARVRKEKSEIDKAFDTLTSDVYTLEHYTERYIPV